ncbi:DNA polymerase III subunit gamma/tau [Eubacterium barkeri]|uniref:DNA-directed DNA polymerase n=1 Tax=Eubacterium barkeri TaxID=1528 RepID=A0A1H3IUC1_EUBBA|nr:DNA polymerase III subunit gamma/tau [Eubacterium barkeri]SDY31336.1 DNA polymerase-3 subunit gamma/tau [Eubacterium barkeri]
MAYLALYRKYRPRTFDAVVGQNFVTQILKNQILSDRVGHAYLFTGIRGTGKTSIAKIFARAINCQDNQHGNPCNVCTVCTEIEKPGVMDIIEIDAASNRGVDEIRDIRDKVKYPPKIGRYKVYIIDEVHMLTKEAFNALLKTLEEPPSHIVFILATTEPNKLPATILSRCQRYDIRPISQEMIVGQMATILKDLGVEMEPGALEIVARRGDHSMRDALSILDQVIDIREGNAPISPEQVLSFLGLTDEDTISHLVGAMLKEDAPEALAILGQLREKGADSSLLMGQIIDCLRNLAVVMAAGSRAGDILGRGESEIQEMKSQCQGIPPQRIFAMVTDFIEDRQKLRYNDLASTVLEMSVLKQCVPMPVVPRVAVTASEQKQQRVQQERPPAAVTERVAMPIASQESTAVKRGQEERSSKENRMGKEEPAKSPVSSNKRTSGSLDIDSIARAMHNGISPLLRGMFLKGRLCEAGPDELVLQFMAPDGEAPAGMLGDQIDLLQKIAEGIAGRRVHFSIKVVDKDYEEMTFLEKTQAILGDEKIPVTEIN